MSQFYEFIKNIKEHRKNYLEFFSNDVQLAERKIREVMKVRLNEQMNYSYQRARFYADSYSTGLDAWNEWAEKNKLCKEFGKHLAQTFSTVCPHEYASEELLEFINQYKFRFIRRRISVPSILQDIYSGYYLECNDCQRIEHEDDMHYAYDENAICSSCIDNYVYSNSRETYISRDDYDEDDEDEDNGIIGEYHSTDIGRIPSPIYDKRKPRVLLGMELEVEVASDLDRYEIAENLESVIGTVKLDGIGNYKYCGFERDGSLDHGFEIVTGYTGLDVHRKALEYFKKPVSGLSSHNTSTCGLHVHICKRDMSLYHAAKMIFFINDEKNLPLIRAIARRTRSSYSAILDKKSDREWLKNAKKCRNPMSNLNQSRYEALNFQNEKTIEFRLFKGSLKYETMVSCLEFTFAVWHFTRNASIRELNTDSFLKFICKDENRTDTPYLRAYLTEKGFSLPMPKKKEKPLPSVLDQNLVLV